MLGRSLLPQEQHQAIAARIRQARTPEAVQQMPEPLWRALALASPLMNADADLIQAPLPQEWQAASAAAALQPYPRVRGVCDGARPSKVLGLVFTQDPLPAPSAVQPTSRRPSMPNPTLCRLALAAALVLSAASASAAAVAVAYTGNYDERVSAPAGDYDAIGGLADVGEFTLLAGSNFFLGGIKTPQDSSDFFLVRVAAGFKLVGASIEWGTNANDFNPIFASPGPLWTLEESDSDPTIFIFNNLGGNRATAPLTYTAPTFERGEGSYGMTIGNGVFAMNNNDPIAYRMNFRVEALTAPPPPGAVPEPATLALAALALAGLGLSRRRKRN